VNKIVCLFFIFYFLHTSSAFDDSYWAKFDGLLANSSHMALKKENTLC